MKQNQNPDPKPRKTWLKKWYAEGIANTIFVWIYNDHINWCLHEDAPYKDTVVTEIDQPLDDYQTNGPPQFVPEIMNEKDLKEMYRMINSAKLKGSNN